MAWQSVKRVMIGFPHGGADKLGMLVLAEHANIYGQCHPSLEKIAWCMCVSRRQAQSVISRLIKQGFVSVKGSRAGGYHKYAMNRYQINFDRLTRADFIARTKEEYFTGQGPATDDEKCSDRGSSRSETPAENIPQTVIEPSKNQKTVNKADLPPFELPSWLEEADWQRWVDHRRFVRAPMNSDAKRLCLKDLEKLRANGHEPADMIDLAISKGWKGFFPPSNAAELSKYQKYAMDRDAERKRASDELCGRNEKQDLGNIFDGQVTRIR